jgi:DNA repair exonuclease SbcCD nuclease subunit
MKILCIGDQHLDTASVKTVELFFDEAIKCAKKTNPDYIICLGDMLHYHNTIYTHSLNKAYSFIERLAAIKPTYILVGNHDMRGPSCFLDEQSHWLGAMKKWENVFIVDTVKTLCIDGFKFVFLPYVPPSRFEEALNTIDNWQDATCIFAHQEFYGCKMGIIDSVDGDKWDIDNPVVISGHIHDRQQPQYNIFYTGASLQTSFGDSSDKTISLLTVYNDTDEASSIRDNIDTFKATPNVICCDIPNAIGCDIIRNIHMTHIELPLPKKKIIYKNIDEIDDWEIPEEAKIKEVDDTHDNYKVTVKGTPSEFKAFKKSNKYKELIKEDIKIVFKHVQQELKDTSSLTQPTKADVVSFNDILVGLIKNDKLSSDLMYVYNTFKS